MIDHNERLLRRAVPQEMLASERPVTPLYSPAFVCKTPPDALGRLTDLALDPYLGGPFFGIGNQLPELSPRAPAPGNGGAARVSN
jgi:hypothetical protein